MQVHARCQLEKSVRINCMIDYSILHGDFRLKGFLMKGVLWQPGNNGTMPLTTIV